MNQHARVDDRANPVHRRRRPAPAAGPRDRRRDRARARPLPVHPGAGGRGGRGRARGVLRRPPRDHLRERHRCAAAAADGEGHRPRRRGDLPGLHLLVPPPRWWRCSARRRCSPTSRRRRFNLDPDEPRARDRGRAQARAHAQGGHPGRSVRPARRSCRDRRRSRRPRGCSCSTTPRRRSARPIATAAVGTLADATATSFFPAKPLGCYGDGGAVFTDDDELAEIMRSLRVHGEGSDKYDCVAHRPERPLRHHPGRGADREAEDLPRRDRGARARSRAAIRRRSPTSRRCRACRRHDLGLGAIHHPAARRAPRRLRRRAEGAGHPDRDLLSPSRVHRAGGLPRLSRWPTAACRSASGSPSEVISLPMHAYLDEPTQDRIIAAVRRRARWRVERVAIRKSVVAIYRRFDNHAVLAAFAVAYVLRPLVAELWHVDAGEQMLSGAKQHRRYRNMLSSTRPACRYCRIVADTAPDFGHRHRLAASRARVRAAWMPSVTE